MGEIDSEACMDEDGIVEFDSWFSVLDRWVGRRVRKVERWRLKLEGFNEGCDVRRGRARKLSWCGSFRWVG